MPRFALVVLGVAALIAWPAACRTPSHASREAAVDRQGPVVELRLAQDSPAPGFVPMELAGHGTVFVARGNVVSDDGIEHVGVDTTTDVLILDSSLSPAAAARLVAATREGVGRMRLAVLIKSRLATAAPIMSAVGASRRVHIVVPVRLGSAEARAIAASVAARWPQ